RKSGCLAERIFFNHVLFLQATSHLTSYQTDIPGGARHGHEQQRILLCRILCLRRALEATSSIPPQRDPKRSFFI
ncbi:MAG: hypothetical protein KHX56_16250, partial [Clostridiales bacterium]|nr:hypothetical protein [Clostridiales bacterium]